MLTVNIENAAFISEALRQIRIYISQDDQLAKMVPFVIQEKGHREKSRFEKLLCYEIDLQAIAVLKEHHNEWMIDPSLFEDHIKSSQWAAMTPWTRAISDHLETEQDKV